MNKFRKNQSPSKKIYALHRDRQRESVLKAAGILFIRDGIDAVRLAEIAEQSGMTRATLYKYFSNKQEIAWAILKTYFEALRDFSQLTLCFGGKTGYECVETFIGSAYAFFWEDLDRTRFMAQFDYVYAGQWKAESMVQLLQEVLGERQHFLIEALRMGIRDCSLRADLEPGLVSATITNMIVGLERRLALMPAHVETEYGQRVEDIYRQTCQLILQGIQRA